MIERSPTSHKGDNGQVAIIGGSETFHGAPLFAALAAEETGVDMVHVFVPACHKEVAKNYSLNFIVHSFAGDHLVPADIEGIQVMLEEMDAVVVGPGLGEHEETLNALKELLPTINHKLVIDASALAVVPEVKLTLDTVVTPHRGEFFNMTEADVTDDAQEAVKVLQEWAEKWQAVIALKGPTDIIMDIDGNSAQNNSGNAGLTVGGTGDALAGVIAGLMAQGMDCFEAALKGCEIIGRAGDMLFEEKGYAYRAIDVIECIPYIMKEQ